jgi:hypothetical protein
MLFVASFTNPDAEGTMNVSRRRAIVALTSAAALSLAGAERFLQAQNVPTAPLSVAVQGGRLTARLENSPIQAVLHELSERTNVAIVAADDLEGALVSAELTNVSVDEGLRNILKDYDTFFYYGAIGQPSGSSLRAVWVYAKGTAATLRPVPLAAWGSTAEIEKAVADRDPAVREQAYDALMSRTDPASRNLVLQAIRGATETDPELRQRLLSNAMSKGVELPHDVLADLVRSDGTEEIRMMALDGLSGDQAALDVAVAALTDPSDVVRERAKEFLLELDNLARRQRQRLR